MRINESLSFKQSRLIKKLRFLLPKKKFVSSSQPLKSRLSVKKKKYRILNNPYFNLGIPSKVLKVEYDPYRACSINLLIFKNKICSYSMHIKGQSPLCLVYNSTTYKNLNTFYFNHGSSFTISSIPPGSVVNQLESAILSGAVYSRSSGVSSLLIRKTESFAAVKLPSGKIKNLGINFFATMGIVSSASDGPRNYYKAGQLRWLGRRPKVRGVAKNPVDHGHGGGEGKRSKDPVPYTF